MEPAIGCSSGGGVPSATATMKDQTVVTTAKTTNPKQRNQQMVAGKVETINQLLTKPMYQQLKSIDIKPW